MTATGAQLAQVLPLTTAIARRHAARLRDPATSRDDLQQVAAVGMLKAADSYDPRFGGFAGWAWRRGEGAVLNAIRDSVPGSRPDRSGEPLRTVSLHALVPGVEDVTLGDTIPAPAADHDLRLTVRQAWDRLDHADRVLLAAMLNETSQRDTARKLGVGQMTVSRRQRAALARLAAMPEIQDCREAAA